MATKKNQKKEFWYVAVSTPHNKLRFVTGFGDHHTAYWYKDKQPMELPKETAMDVAWGLSLNGFLAFAVCSGWERAQIRYASDEENTDEEMPG